MRGTTEVSRMFQTNHSSTNLDTLESFRFLLTLKGLESLKQCNCLVILSYNAMSEKCFVNDMVKLLMVGFQQPSQMMESVATALQSRQKCKDLNLVEFHLYK